MTFTRSLPRSLYLGSGVDIHDCLERKDLLDRLVHHLRTWGVEEEREEDPKPRKPPRREVTKRPRPPSTKASSRPPASSGPEAEPCLEGVKEVLEPPLPALDPAVTPLCLECQNGQVCRGCQVLQKRANNSAVRPVISTSRPRDAGRWSNRLVLS